MISNSADEFYNSIGYHANEAFNLYYTYQCNIQCDHCCYNCGPQRTEKMSMEDAKHILKGAASSGKRVLELMGGELFLNYEELSELIFYSYGIGLYVLVDTNGFWGKNFETAKCMLENLSDRGLKAISLSIDTFHQQFIPLAYPLNVIRAAHELGISSSCNFCVSSDLAKDQNLLNDIKKETNRIFIINPVPFGRASCLQRVPEIEYCKMLCIHILVNGNTFACCGHSDENKDIINTPLYMGNCIQEDPGEVLGRKNLLCLKAFFDPNSPIWFKKFLEQEPYKKMYENKRFSHICELCIDLLHNGEISRKVIYGGAE